MKISLNWLRDYVQLDAVPQAFCSKEWFEQKVTKGTKS
jgi:hypothetical protein